MYKIGSIQKPFFVHTCILMTDSSLWITHTCDYRPKLKYSNKGWFAWWNQLMGDKTMLQTLDLEARVTEAFT